MRDDSVELAPDALDGAARHGGDAQRRGIRHEVQAVDDVLFELLAALGRRDEIPLVEQDDKGAAGLVRHAGEALVLLRDADGGVYDEQHDVGALDGALGAHVGVVLEVLRDRRALAHAGRVDEAVALAVVLDDGVHEVARRAGNVGDDGALHARHAVEQRRLARVGAADDGDAHHVVRVVILEVGKQRNDLVEQVADAVALRRGDGAGVANAQAVELVGVGVLLDGVALVDSEQDGAL